MTDIAIRQIEEKDDEELAKLIRAVFEEFDACLGNSGHTATTIHMIKDI